MNLSKILNKLTFLWYKNYNFRLFASLGILVLLFASFIFVNESKKQQAKFGQMPQETPKYSVLNVEPTCMDNPEGAKSSNQNRSKYSWKAFCKDPNKAEDSCWNGTDDTTNKPVYNAKCDINPNVHVGSPEDTRWCYGFDGPFEKGKGDHRNFRCLQLQPLNQPPTCQQTDADTQSQVKLEVLENKLRVDNTIKFKVSSQNNSTGSTWIHDKWDSDVIDCGSSDPNIWGEKTCRLKTGSTVTGGQEITWTHYWKNCLDDDHNCNPAQSAQTPVDSTNYCLKPYKFKVPLKIEGTIFLDTNPKNEKKDAGEPAITGAIVHLSDHSDKTKFDKTFTTGSDGHFIFYPPPGKYDGTIDNLSNIGGTSYAFTTEGYPASNVDLQTDLSNVDVGLTPVTTTSTPTLTQTITLTPTITLTTTLTPTISQTTTPSPTPSRTGDITTDKTSYNVGEKIKVCYTLSPQVPTTLKIIDILADGTQTTPWREFNDNGTGDCLTATISLPAGQEKMQLWGKVNSSFVLFDEASFTVNAPANTATPTLTPTSAPTSTSVPTLPQTPTLTTAPTSTRTPSATLTPTIPQNIAKILFNMKFQSIGFNANSDPKNPVRRENNNPKHATRQVKIEVFNAQNSKVTETTGNLTYDSGLGWFIGTVNINNIQTGDYFIKMKADRYLRRLIGKEVNQPMQHIIADGQTVNVMPTSSLIVGDINNDNNLDIQDYNEYLSCFGGKISTNSCRFKENTDLNDDGITDTPTNLTDYAWMFESFRVQKGD